MAKASEQIFRQGPARHRSRKLVSILLQPRSTFEATSRATPLPRTNSSLPIEGLGVPRCAPDISACADRELRIMRAVPAAIYALVLCLCRS